MKEKLKLVATLALLQTLGSGLSGFMTTGGDEMMDDSMAPPMQTMEKDTMDESMPGSRDTMKKDSMEKTMPAPMETIKEGAMEKGGMESDMSGSMK
jgi:hypothetical protein